MRWATIIGLLPLLASCGSNIGQETSAGRVGSLARQVVPPGSGGACTSPTTTMYSVSVTCDLTTSWSGDSYRQWVDRQLSGRFRSRELPGAHLLMTRYGDGETQQFDISTSPLPDPSTRIRIVLEVYAD